GSAKAFGNERIELTWYANKKSLLFQGIQGNKLKESMINFCKNNDMALDANPNDKPEAVSSSNNNISTNNIHSERSVLHPPNTVQVSRIQNQSTECLKCCHLAAEMAETMQKVDGLSIMMNKVYQCVSSLLTKNNVTAVSGRENIRDSSTQVDLISAIGNNCCGFESYRSEFSTDLEGVKLDTVIMESKLSTEIHSNTQAITGIHSELKKIQNDHRICIN
ncbi:Hypothetical predicted protein, partial [Paramuricea clavata]